MCIRDRSTVGELNLVAMMDMMTIILVFLLKSYSGSVLSIDAPNIDIPTSTHQIAPEEALKLTVTRIGAKEPGEIIIGDNETVLTLDSKMVQVLKRQANRRQFRIDKLFKDLKVKAEQAKAEADQIKTRTFEGKILIAADKETPYWLVTQVLLSSAEAGYDKYHLVSVKKDQ